ncbi:MAG: glutamate ligase domain-containing protein, partial [Candidatus Limnocylindrales bacterium]
SPAGATAVVNVADAGGADVAAALADTDLRLVTTAVLPESADDAALIGDHVAVDYRFRTRRGAAATIVGRIVAQEPGATVLRVRGLDTEGGIREVRLETAGRHNAANALGVAAAAKALGVPADAIVAGLGTFHGVGRRLERKGEAAGVVVYDDYGHHPTAIRATIEAIRQREPGRRIWAVYEPLTYHRTAAFLPAFADALATADAVAIADIWAGRDPDTTVASAGALAEAVAKVRSDIPVHAPGSVEATAAWLAHEVRRGDVVLVMGGGHSYRIAAGLLQRLDGTGSTPT